ncbi:LEA type 2 family protein [Marinoscillum pacificum]|uniref:LEA type 2 family protein n=1 Tax=Marinoscillum pacificum TaxID=392723 RepID=UPI0021588C78|nr:LEA type 2 family protein [Marinoscillum pacificum]
MRYFILPFIAVLLLTQCGRPDQEPEFIAMENVKVSKVTGKEAVLSANAKFYNPNDQSIKLKQVMIDIEVDDRIVGKIDQDMKFKIPANDYFSVPLKASFNIRDLGLLNGIISVLGGKPVRVHYKGYIKVGLYGYVKKVPIDFEEDVRM